jgi:metal-responsive CopG/Arc/MetJ family transcriptional regulator
MTRLNITLPDDIAQKLATKRNKSRFIAEALKEKMERETKEQIERLLFEGYNATDKKNADVNTDWANTDLEGWE